MYVESVINPFIGKQVLDIEQISRMLSVQCCNQFPCIEVGKRNDLDFSEAELLLYDGPDCFQLRGIDSAPKDGSDFDLDLSVSLTNKDEGSARVGAVGDDAIRDRFTNPLGNTTQRRSYPDKRCLSVLNRQINQIDVHRKTRQVSNEKIDCCSALESKASLGRHIGQYPDE
jgi:hypothetical protein